MGAEEPDSDTERADVDGQAPGPMGDSACPSSAAEHSEASPNLNYDECKACERALSTPPCAPEGWCKDCVDYAAVCHPDKSIAELHADIKTSEENLSKHKRGLAAFCSVRNEKGEGEIVYPVEVSSRVQLFEKMDGNLSSMLIRRPSPDSSSPEAKRPRLPETPRGAASAEARTPTVSPASPAAASQAMPAPIGLALPAPASWQPPTATVAQQRAASVALVAPIGFALPAPASSQPPTVAPAALALPAPAGWVSPPTPVPPPGRTPPGGSRKGKAKHPAGKTADNLFKLEADVADIVRPFRCDTWEADLPTKKMPGWLVRMENLERALGPDTSHVDFPRVAD